MFPKSLKTSAEYPAVLEFFEKLLRSGSVCRLEDEYPLAFHASHLDHIFVTRLPEGLSAGLVTLEREIEHQRNSTLRALFIGSVVTEPAQRNRGLQRQLFHAVEEVAESWGIDILVLWSNQLEFYQKLGFELAGLQASWISNFEAPLARTKIETKIGSSLDLPLTEKWFDAFQKKSFRVRRSLDEMKKLWRIPRMTVACTENAYALLGKGEDFHGVCHEWAGPGDEVLACIDALRKVTPQLRILSPGVVHHQDEASVVEALEAASFECRLEYLGLFKAISSRIQISSLAPEDLKYPFFIWGLDSI